MNTERQLLFYNDLLAVDVDAPVAYSESVKIAHALYNIGRAAEMGLFTPIASYVLVACENCDGTRVTKNGTDCFECGNGKLVAGDVVFKGDLEWLVSRLPHNKSYHPILVDMLKKGIIGWLEYGNGSYGFSSAYGALFDLLMGRAMDLYGAITRIPLGRGAA